RNRADQRVDALEIVDQVDVQRAGLDALHGVPGQPLQVSGGVLELQVAEARLFLDELLRITYRAVEEHGHAEAQVVHQPCVQVADLGHAGFGERASLADFLVLDVVDDSLDRVADLLHADREADDVRPAAALVLVQGLARNLDQVVLDCRIQVVDGVVQIAHLFRELQVVGLDHVQHAAQHPFDDIGQVQVLSGGTGEGERRRRQRRRVEIPSNVRGAAFRLRQPASHGACYAAGEAEEQQRYPEVQGEMEHDHRDRVVAEVWPDVDAPQSDNGRGQRDARGPE